MSFTADNKLKTAVRCLLGLMIAGSLLAPAAMAADAGVGTAIMLIRPIRSYGESGGSDTTIRPQDVFDVVGTLNAIEGNQITIGDRQMTLASNVSASGIVKWTEVGVKLNTAGEVAVIEIVSDELH
jgi:hypothetical protein